MSFSAAVACGPASESLRRSWADRIASGDVAVRSHDDLAVAWSTSCPWIDVHDDGEVLVLLDGRLHNLSSPSASQAELLLRRYRASGIDVARGLLGDFVVIVLDRPTSRLLVARDPVGVRPWYAASSGRRHAGAADLATIAALPWVDTTVNERIAIEYLAAVEESRGQTLYAGISTLRPGRTWCCDGGRDRTLLHHRWDLEPELETPWDDAAERCRALFDEAVSSRLAGGGPATSQLSGGLDSSTVVGTIALLGRDDLLVGRLVFEGSRADERGFSDAVIEHWQVPAISVPPWIPGEEESRDLVRRLRRPLPDANFTMFASLDRALAHVGRRENLTGLGGDDAFLAMGIGPRVVSAVKLRQRRVGAHLARWTVENPRRTWPEVVRPTLGYLVQPWRRGRRPPWVRATASASADLAGRRGQRPERVTGVDAIDERLASLTSGYDASILEARAVIGDLEGRRESHPFLDPRFVRATYGLDPWWPTRGGHTRALQLAAFGDRLPPVVAGRRSKAEFSEIFWPQLLVEGVLDRVRTGPVAELGWLDPAGYDALVANAKEGKANAAIPLSRCVSLDHWMRTR